MRRYAPLLLIVVLFLGCRRGVPAAHDGPAPGPDSTRGYGIPVPQVTVLAGKDLESDRSGVWSIRRVAGARPAAGGRDRSVDFAADSPAGMREPSAPPPAPARAAEGESLGPDEADADEPVAAAGRLAMPTTPAGPSAAPSAARADEVAGGAGSFARPGGGIALAKRAAPAQSALKAGTTDDNEQYAEFLAFLATWSDNEGVADRYKDVDVRDRTFVRVTDANGRPVPGARVQVIYEAGDDVIFSGTTYGDGRLPYYPNAVDVAVASTEPPVFLVQALAGDHRAQAEWVPGASGADLELVLDGAVAAPDEIPLDVCFVIDTTGSMADEIARIKATLLSVTAKLEDIEREFSLRYGAVLYRDLTDAYVTKAHPFTADIGAFSKALNAVQAQGGGDTPESLNQGLAEAVGRMGWRDGAAKVMFLVADAPPHMDYEGDVTYDIGMRGAVDRGIRIHSVAASGLDAFGSLMFRQIAQYTRGKFIFIEYGGNVAASGEKHGVGGVKKSNNLDDILFDQIQDELANWGRDFAAESTEISLSRD